MAEKPFIGSVALKNLGSKDQATRVRTLHQLLLVLKNNILWADEAGSEDETTLVSVRALITHLLRWFTYRPLVCETEILELLFLILSRRHFISHVSKQISVSRIITSMEKIAALPISQQNIAKAQSIIGLLENYIQESQEQGMASASRSSSDFELPHHVPSDPAIENQRRLQMPSPTPSVSARMDNRDVPYTHQGFWEKLQGTHLAKFELVDAELAVLEGPNAVDKVLTFLRASIVDYPPEFYLQPPYIIESLINVISKVPAKDAIQVVHLLRYIANGLKERWPDFLRAVRPDIEEVISVSAFLNRILSMLSDYFERIHDNFSVGYFEGNIPVLNEMYLLLYDTASFVKLTHNACDLKMNELLNMLAKVTRDLRLSYSQSQGRLIRLHYMILLYMINVLVASIDITYIYVRCHHNEWETECDAGLLDVALFISYPRLYSLIRENRWKRIRDDAPLMLMIDSRAHWRPVVQIFQTWEKMSDEEILIKGHRAINTIRIHRNFELIELLIKKVLSAAEAVIGNEPLRLKSEEIILRLFSNEEVGIRRYSYSIARQLVQAKFEEGVDDLTALSLTTVFGIPITAEIVTEVLCFGLLAEDEAVRNHSRYILFALLRSNMVYASHWGRILTVIRPVLPLLMCLVNSSEKDLGVFVFDVYQERNGFDDLEVNMGLARFLYSRDTNIRQMAMKKMLTNLQIPHDIITYIPDNFCIVPRGIVHDLRKPNAGVGFPEEAYQVSAKFLTTYDFKDPENLKSALVQLSCLMSSSLECCLQAHKDNVWVPFMLPDFGLPPNNMELRQLVIQVLYNFTVSVKDLRVYYASKPEIFTFLIHTLIYFQEFESIKKEASIILFLLLFSDYVVNSEVSTSLAKIIRNLCCPFKFKYHWEESPFNSIGKLEEHRETEDTEEKKEISERCMRLSFALEWFHGERKLIDMKECNYYDFLDGKPMLVHNDLRLTDSDLALIKHTHGERILEKYVMDMTNATNAQTAQELVTATQSFLKLPFTFEEEHVEVLRGGIDRMASFAASGDQRNSITGVMDVYRQLLPLFSNRKVVDFFNKRFVFGVIMNGTNTQGEPFVENLKVINAVVKECENRKELMNMLITNFEKQHKVYLPSRIVEKILFWLFEDQAAEIRWMQESRRPQLRMMLIIMRNVLKIMPIQLDDAFLLDVLFKLVLKGLPRTKINPKQRIHQNSSVTKYIFGIAEAITSKIKRPALQDAIYKALAFWSIHENAKNRSLALMTIVNLTSNKQDFLEFGQTFGKVTKVPLFILAVTIFRESQKFVTPLDQNAAAILIGNVLEFDPREETICGFLHIELVRVLETLIRLNNVSALCFIVRKMVTCNTPHYVDIIKEKRIVQTLMMYTISDDTAQSEYQLLADQFETITMCHENEALSEHVNEIVMLHSNAYFMLMFKVSCEDDPVFKNFTLKAFNHMLLMIGTEVGIARITQALNKRSTVTQFLFASHYNLKTKNHPNELIFQLNFWHDLFILCDNVENSAIDLICNSEVRQEHVEMIVKDIGNHKLFKDLSFANGADFLVVQLMTIFDMSFSSKINVETKHELKTLSFLCLKMLFKKSEKARKFFEENDIISYIADLLDLSISVMRNHRYLETNKKNGVQKCNHMIKDLIILLKAFIEWRLPLENHQRLVAEITIKLMKINDWLEADVVLNNNYTNLLRLVMTMEIGEECVSKDAETFPLLKSVLKKTQAMSTKPPHTDTNLALIRNGLLWLMSCGQFVEARVVFKNVNAFQIFENIHPHIHPNRKSTWDNVALEWLHFFEFLSKYEDTECKPHHVQQLCRMIRLGNNKIRASTLRVIRNSSTKTSIGVVLLNSEDFRNTVDAILTDTADGEEKSLVLQTLLSVGGQSEQCRAKLKNSPLNRKLKDQLSSMREDPRLPRTPSFVSIYNLADMLRTLLDHN